MNGETRDELRATIRRLAAEIRRQDKKIVRLKHLAQMWHASTLAREKQLATIREIVAPK